MFKQMKIYDGLMESAYMFLIQLIVLSNQPPIGDFLGIPYGKCKPSNHVSIMLFFSMVLHRRVVEQHCQLDGQLRGVPRALRQPGH